MKGQELQLEAARELREAGYAVTTEHQVTTLGKRTACIDIVALAPDADGILVPAFIVEVTSPRHPGHLEGAVRQLQFYAPLVGVERAYVFDGKWHVASPDFTSLTPTTLPTAPAPLV